VTTPVRPSIIPQAHVPQGTQGSRSAGQRAFFEAALGKAPAPAVAAAPQAPTAHVQRVPTSLPAEPPARILRPGSLLDIKV
jgi:hypothetical protein